MSEPIYVIAYHDYETMTILWATTSVAEVQEKVALFRARSANVADALAAMTEDERESVDRERMPWEDFDQPERFCAMAYDTEQKQYACACPALGVSMGKVIMYGY